MESSADAGYTCSTLNTVALRKHTPCAPSWRLTHKHHGTYYPLLSQNSHVRTRSVTHFHSHKCLLTGSRTFTTEDRCEERWFWSPFTSEYNSHYDCRDSPCKDHSCPDRLLIRHIENPVAMRIKLECVQKPTAEASKIYRATVG